MNSHHHNPLHHEGGADGCPGSAATTRRTHRDPLAELARATPAPRRLPSENLPTSRRVLGRLMHKVRLERDTTRAVRRLCELGGHRLTRTGEEVGAMGAAAQEVVAGVRRRCADFQQEPGPLPLGGARRAARDAFRRITSAANPPGYSSAAVPGLEKLGAPGAPKKRGDLTPSVWQWISLPDRPERRFQLVDVVPELADGPAAFLGNAAGAGDEEPPAAPFRAYADPNLRGRRRGKGDGLERLALRFLASGMAIPTRRAAGAPGLCMFTVLKKFRDNGDQEQRIVFDMRAVNQAWRSPPPCTMGSLTALAQVELGQDGAVEILAGDVPDMFYMMQLPHSFAPHLWLEGLDFEYVRACALRDGDSPERWEGADSIGMVVPVMGLSWSPIWAQTAINSVMRGVLPELPAGARRDHGADRFTLGAQGKAYTTFIDDWCIVCKEATREAAQRESARVLEDTRAALHAKGFGCHKVQQGTQVTNLGAVVDGQARELRPVREKLRELQRATRHAARQSKLSVNELQRLLGHWAWWATLSRGLFSVFEESYAFLFSENRTVPYEVRAELSMAADLAPMVFSRLDRPYDPEVAMVDAGPEFGAVVVGRPKEPPHGSGTSSETKPADVSRWRVAHVHRWQKREHNNVTEARTVVMAASRFGRRSSARGRRWLVWTDSMVTLGAFRKGRSSSRPLNRQCRRIAALLWAHDAELVLRYVPSAENWADGPSRGLAWACVAPETVHKSLRKCEGPGPPEVRPPPGL